MIYIFDREENLLKILNDDEIEEFEYNIKLNSERKFNFTTSNVEYIRRYNKVGFFDKDDKFQLFFIDDFKKHIDIDSCTIQVTCLADFYSLNNFIIEDKRIRAGSAREALTKALENSSYMVGVVESFENQDISFYFMSKLKALNKILETYICEFDVRVEINETGTIGNKYIDLKHRLGQDTALRFTYDTALNYIEKSIITESHFNVLYGRGKSLETDEGGYSRKLTFENVNNDKKYVEDQESIKKYGRLEGIYENENIEDESVLLESTKEALKTTKEVKFSYSASVKDLSKFSKFEHYKYELGDSILVIDEELDIIIESRIIEINESKEDTVITLSNFQNGLFDNDVSDQIDNIKDKIDNVANGEIDESKYPNTLPDVPVLNAKGLFATVSLEWTFENKSYYTYEIYASQIKDFNPNIFDKIYEGKASAFLHEVKPRQTWYYRCRAKNTHNKYTNFSQQIEASTLKIVDGTEYFESAAINDALIGELRLDRGWVGRLTGTYIDAKNLSVTDGNGNKTLDIDSFGNVSLNVKALNINSEEVVTINDINNLETSTNEKISKIEQTSNSITQSVERVESDVRENSNKISIAEEKLTADGIFNTVKNKFETISSANLIQNSLGRLGHKYWNVGKHTGSGTVEWNTLDTINEKRNGFEFVIKNSTGTRAGVLSYAIPVRPDAEYTLTASSIAQRGSNIKIEIMCWSSVNNNYNISPDIQKLYAGELKNSQETSLTFTAPRGTYYINIYLYGEYTQSSPQANYAHYGVTWLRLNPGGVGFPWSESATYNETRIAQKADKIDIQGLVTFTNLKTPGQTIIDAENVKTGTLKAINIEGCNFLGGNFRGTTSMYLTEGSYFACDGNVYARNFYVPETHEGWQPGVKGSFAVAPDAYFDKLVSSKQGFRYNNHYVPYSMIGGQWVIEHMEGEVNRNGANFLFLAMLGGKTFGVDMWDYTFLLNQSKDFKQINNATIGLDSIKQIPHYTGVTKIGNTCFYNPKTMPREFVYETKSDTGTTINVSPSSLLPCVTLAIQEQQKQIESLKNEIESLKSLNSSSKQRMHLVSSTYFKIKKFITDRVIKCS